MKLGAHEKSVMWAELLDAIKETSREDYPMPNITAREYAAEIGVARNAAYRRLEKAAADGRVERSPEKALVGGQWCHVYWKKPVDSPEEPTHDG